MRSTTQASFAENRAAGTLHSFKGIPLKHIRPGTLWLLLLNRTSGLAVKFEAALRESNLLCVERTVASKQNCWNWLQRLRRRYSPYSGKASLSYEVRYGPHLVAHGHLMSSEQDISALSFVYNGETLDAQPWSLKISGVEASSHSLQLIVLANAPIYSQQERAISSISFDTLKDRCSRITPVLSRPEKPARWPFVELEPGLLIGGEVARGALLMEWGKYKRTSRASLRQKPKS